MVGFFFADSPWLEESSNGSNDTHHLFHVIDNDAPQHDVDNDASHEHDGLHILPPIDEAVDHESSSSEDSPMPDLEAQDISFSPNSAISESLHLSNNNQSMGDLAEAIAEDSSIFSPLSPNDSFDYVSEACEESPVIVSEESLEDSSLPSTDD